MVATSWPSTAEVPPVVQSAVGEGTTGPIADALFDTDNGFVLAFEVASVLLLAAIIGAIALVREK